MDKVLLVDDDEVSNFITKIMLENAGVGAVVVVLNGQEALEYLEQERPDFIFLDIKMPVMDGWEFLEETKARGIDNDINIALLSSSSHPEDIKKAGDYDHVIALMEKPLTKVRLDEVMEMFKEKMVG